MDVVSLLIKPASRHCNLRCDYCFYYDVSQYQEQSIGTMPFSIMHTLIDNALNSAQRAVIFAFQGGEPTLAGLDYFQEFVYYVSIRNTKNLAITYALQTNGTLLTEEWARFFKLHHFLIGVSLDGYPELHDYHRYDIQNRGSYQRVLKGIRELEKEKVPFNILTVINKQSVKHAKKIYRNFQKLGFHHLQFIPALAPLGVNPEEDPLALTSEGYGRFLDDLFPLYQNDFKNLDPVSIRFFDNMVGMALGFKAQACEQQGRCALNFVVESNGDVYPCDFYSTTDWKLGNIHTHTFAQLEQSPLAHQFVSESIQKDPQCAECPYQNLCLGGCKRHRQIDIHQPLQLNYFCEAYQYFFSRHYQHIYDLAATIRPNRRL